jgi:hypothetical protein
MRSGKIFMGIFFHEGRAKRPERLPELNPHIDDIFIFRLSRVK